ncbi:MAG: undecaprenyl-phosphate glucose phosphotransferase [Tardiphaga sp.]|jgi:Undecaprenyl-phosphate glucose phosphotransferase|nr:undecaprenyl-phosphate glucose phosphotransferase [Tardiphaga sp.]
MNILSTKAHDDRRASHSTIVRSAFDESQTTAFWSAWLRPRLVERVMVIVDALLILCCGLASAVGYHWYSDAGLGKIDVYAAASILVALNFVLLVTVQRGYRIKSIASPLRQIRIAALSWSGLFAVLLAIGFTMKISGSFSRGATLLFFSSGLLALTAWKATAAALTARALRSGAFTNSRIVVIAEQGLAASSQPLRELRQHGYRPARVMEISAAELSSPLLMSAIAPRFQELIGFARDNRIEHVYLLLSWSKQHAIDSVLDALKVLPIPVHLIPDAHVARFLRYPLADAGGSWTAELRRAPLSKGERRLKRLFDLAGASAALLLFAPIMLAAAVLIKCEARGPILFRQTRNGFNGRAFRIYKFRSMRVTEDGPTIVQATRHDARVTGVGRWLRKTSIDELPQLFNVLSGEMSLVGPRPHAAAHNSQYQQIIGNYAYRHHVKPGITGWAQVNGYRGETSTVGLMEKRVEYDLWYINNWSVWLDVRIMFSTAMIGFRQSAAY